MWEEKKSRVRTYSLGLCAAPLSTLLCPPCGTNIVPIPYKQLKCARTSVNNIITVIVKSFYPMGVLFPLMPGKCYHSKQHLGSRTCMTLSQDVLLLWWSILLGNGTRGEVLRLTDWTFSRMKAQCYPVLKYFNTNPVNNHPRLVSQKPPLVLESWLGLMGWVGGNKKISWLD